MCSHHRPASPSTGHPQLRGVCVCDCDLWMGAVGRGEGMGAQRAVVAEAGQAWEQASTQDPCSIATRISLAFERLAGLQTDTRCRGQASERTAYVLHMSCTCPASVQHPLSPDSRLHTNRYTAPPVKGPVQVIVRNTPETWSPIWGLRVCTPAGNRGQAAS